MFPPIDPYITQEQNKFMKIILNTNLNPVHHFPYFTHALTPSIPLTNSVTQMINYNLGNIVNPAQNYRIANKKHPFSNSNHQQNNYYKRKDALFVTNCNKKNSTNPELSAAREDVDYSIKRKTEKRNLFQSIKKLKQGNKTNNLSAESLQLQCLMNTYKNYIENDGLTYFNESTRNDSLSMPNFEEEDFELCCCKINLKNESLRIRKEMWDAAIRKFPDITKSRFERLLDLLKNEMKHDFSEEDESNKENEHPIDLSMKSSNDRTIFACSAFHFYRSRTLTKATKKSKKRRFVRL